MSFCQWCQALAFSCWTWVLFHWPALLICCLVGVSSFGGVSLLDMDMPRRSSSLWSTFDWRMGRLPSMLGMKAGVERPSLPYLWTCIKPSGHATLIWPPTAAVLLLRFTCACVPLFPEDILALFTDDWAWFILWYISGTLVLTCLNFSLQVMEGEQVASASEPWWKTGKMVVADFLVRELKVQLGAYCHRSRNRFSMMDRVK